MNEGCESSLGAQWQERLTRMQAKFDHSVNLAGFVQDQDELERRADDYLKNLRTEHLLDGIGSCITRGSNALGIDMPAIFVASKAFAGFRRWAEENNLLVAVSGFQVRGYDTIKAQLTLLPNFES